MKRAFLVDHDSVKSALGYRIHYKRCKLVITGDTKVVTSLAENAENAENADVLINEAFSHYFYEQKKKDVGKSKDPRLSLAYLNETRHYYSDTWQPAKMAQKFKVKRLFLTHLVPAIGTSSSVKHLFTKGMRQFYKGPITVTDDRDQIVLDSKNGKCSVIYPPEKQFKIKVYKISKK